MRFKRIYIEITNTCNLQCRFCIQNSRPSRFMQVEEFSYILQQIRPFCEYIYLHVLGEPLAHPKLSQLLLEAQRLGFKVHITTNGTMLKEKFEVLKQASIRQINVSLHSFPQHFQPNYINDVFMVCEELAQRGIFINYRLWCLQEEGMEDTTKNLLQDIRNRYDQDIVTSQIQRLNRISLRDHIALHLEEEFLWPSLKNPYVNDCGQCKGMREMCAILVDGTLVPCCLDSEGTSNLGNVFTTSFEKLIESNKAQAIREGFKNQHVVEELCQHCSYRLRFTKDKGGK